MSGAAFIQTTFLILASHAQLDRRGLFKRLQQAERLSRSIPPLSQITKSHRRRWKRRLPY